MDRRTYEGPMDWEYQDNMGPVDMTSPFAQFARNKEQNIFSSPSKVSSLRPNPFSKLNSPSKPQPPPPSSLFSPKIQPGPTAPPFRNPAFTTPRKPFDEQIFSEASGAESSPGSEYPNDTPDLDRIGDLDMGTITPTKVDKALRYGKAGHQSRRRVPGRGEIPRGNRDLVTIDTMRKRKRHNHDKDVGSVRQYHPTEIDDSEVSGDNETEQAVPPKSAGPSRKRQGWLGNLFTALERHPNAPDQLYKWMKLAVNFVIVAVGVGLIFAVVHTIRTDINNANEAARAEITNQVLRCQNEYTVNQCSKKDRPALQAACDEWYDCMMRDPEAAMKVKATVKQIAEVLNEFSGTMHLKAWFFFFGLLLVCILANNLTLGRMSISSRPPPQPPMPSYPAAGPMPANGPAPWNTDYVWMHTPSRQRMQDFITEGTDTDTSPPPFKAMVRVPSLRRSPSKGDRPRSPKKLSRSPSKGY